MRKTLGDVEIVLVSPSSPGEFNVDDRCGFDIL